MSKPSNKISNIKDPLVRSLDNKTLIALATTNKTLKNVLNEEIQRRKKVKTAIKKMKNSRLSQIVREARTRNRNQKKMELSPLSLVKLKFPSFATTHLVATPGYGGGHREIHSLEERLKRRIGRGRYTTNPTLSRDPKNLRSKNNPRYYKEWLRRTDMPNPVNFWKKEDWVLYHTYIALRKGDQRPPYQIYNNYNRLPLYELTSMGY